MALDERSRGLSAWHRQCATGCESLRMEAHTHTHTHTHTPALNTRTRRYACKYVFAVLSGRRMLRSTMRQETPVPDPERSTAVWHASLAYTGTSLPTAMPLFATGALRRALENISAPF